VSGAVSTGLDLYKTAVIGSIAGIGGILGEKEAEKKLAAPDLPTLQAPNALSPTATREEASKVAIRRRLEAEQRQASTSTMLTGGAGLLDQPTTTSRTLLGS